MLVHMSDADRGRTADRTTLGDNDAPACLAPRLSRGLAGRPRQPRRAAPQAARCPGAAAASAFGRRGLDHRVRRRAEAEPTVNQPVVNPTEGGFPDLSRRTAAADAVAGIAPATWERAMKGVTLNRKSIELSSGASGRHGPASGTIWSASTRAAAARRAAVAANRAALDKAAHRDRRRCRRHRRHLGQRDELRQRARQFLHRRGVGEPLPMKAAAAPSSRKNSTPR